MTEKYKSLPELSLLMPMVGRGSRFSEVGIKEPKPLIELYGRPFFWWAVESVRRVAFLKELVFVVLEEHCVEFGIHLRIAQYYPTAKIIKIPEVTAGAAETAYVGLAAIEGSGPIAINDCDHAFITSDLANTVEALLSSTAGALLCFRSSSPAYSYIDISDTCEIVGTIEKKVVSPFAIAGCYFFSSAAVYNRLYKKYITGGNCNYKELFISGLFNMLRSEGGKILKLDVEQHCAFGTPAELNRITNLNFSEYLKWKKEE